MTVTQDITFIPRYEDCHRLPCVAGTSGNVSGGRFVDVAAAQQPGWQGLATDTLGGHTIVARCAAGKKPLGIAAWTADDGDEVTTYRGHAVPMVAGGAVTAGDEVESDATGRAVKLGTLGATAATADSSGAVANNNQLTYKAVEPGAEGNGIQVILHDPGTQNASLSVAVSGRVITVNLATANDSGKAITSTGATVLAAIQASAPASALIQVAHKGASTGAGAVVAQESPGATLAGGVSSDGASRAGGKALSTASQAGDLVLVVSYM